MKRRDALAGLCAAALWPSAALAQQPGRVYRIGFLGQRSLPWLVDPLVAALRPHGWVLGRNFLLEVRATGPDPKRAVDMAGELVVQRVDLIVAVGTHMALAARQATSTVPIVMYASGWPVEGGLVASYARPGGNITGLSLYGSETLYTKFMSLIAELLPGVRQLGVIWDYVPPTFLEKEAELGVGGLRRAARLLNVNTREWMVRTESDLHSALSAVATAPIEVLFATSGPVHGQPPNVARINELAVRRRLPLICDIAGSVFQGGALLAYSVSWNEVAVRCASFVNRILRGANPAELPIEQPTNFELVINLKTAKAIGLGIPPAMLIRADKVIE